MKYIVTADWHLRSQKPRCRLDSDWMETQRKALSRIIECLSIKSEKCKIAKITQI